MENQTEVVGMLQTELLKLGEKLAKNFMELELARAAGRNRYVVCTGQRNICAPCKFEGTRANPMVARGIFSASSSSKFDDKQFADSLAERVRDGAGNRAWVTTEIEAYERETLGRVIRLGNIKGD